MQNNTQWILWGLLIISVFTVLSAFAQEDPGQSSRDTEREMQQSAGIQMLAWVIGGLITTLVLLRWVGSRQKGGNLPKQDNNQQVDLIQRAMQALKEQEESKKQKH